MELPIKMTEDAFRELTNDYQGICLNCGEYRDACEPDARKYPCDGCKKRRVYGAEELLLMGKIEIVD